MLVWCDLETTGLDPRHDPILEIALVVTDDALNEVAAYERVILRRDGLALRHWAEPVVQQMHDKNGLWRDLKNGEPRGTVQREALDFLRGTGLPAKKIPICGSTIAFDRAFLREQMPDLEAWFSHRNFDVSVFREAAERWNPAVFAGRPQGEAHRALADIRQSIEAARYYREHFLRVA